MLLVLLIALIFGYMGYKTDSLDRALHSFIMTLVGLVFSIVVTIAINSFMPALNLAVYEVKSTPIQSLYTGVSSSGQFVLGTGVIEGEVYYYCYKIIGHNRYRLLKLRASDCTIIESNSTPRLQRITTKSKVSSLYIFYIAVIETNYTLFVPPNTVVREFKTSIK